MLEVKNLKKSYGKKQVLKDVTFSVNDGEIMGFIGINGSGKSTMIETITGVKKFNGGSVFIDGCDIKKDRKQVKKKIGYMPQTFSLFNDLTVRENIAYLCAVYSIDGKNIIDKICSECMLDEYKNTLAQNLSGGYRQLLSFVSAIIHSPKYLILDEPTSAMDPVFRKKFWNIVKQFREKGITIIVITHYMEELMLCDTFACLSDGVIAFSGKTSEITSGNTIPDIEKVLEKYSQVVTKDE